MRAFTYVRAQDTSDAVGRFRPGTAYLGGGTNLVDLMRLGVASPDQVVDVSRLPYDQVRPAPDGGLLIGATVRNSDLAAHPLVRAHYPMLARALLSGAARVHVTGPGTSRIVPMPGLHRLPGAEPHHDTVLTPGELITAVELPPPLPGRSAYRKVRERASFAFALVSVAALIDIAGDGTVGTCRVALGGVAHAPWRAFLAERTLAGAPATAETFARAAAAELDQAVPLARNDYKVTLARNLIAVTLEELAQ